MPDRLRDLSPRDVEVRRRIGSNVRRLRKQRGRTLVWVAGRAGVSDATLARIEHGKQVITTDVLDRLARALGASATSFYRRNRTQRAAG